MFNKKYFSTQAKIAVVGYILLILAILVPVPNNSLDQTNDDYNLGERIISILGLMIPMAISVYTINCMVQGISKGGMPCTVLAWLNSLSVVVWCALVLILTLLLKNKNDNGVEGYSDLKIEDLTNKINEVKQKLAEHI
jgi:predicted neutral ceramidase superfamily lipid hydrolase